ADSAAVAGTAGVHLRSADVSPHHTREIWSRSKTCGAGALARENPPPIIGVSCHSEAEVLHAKETAADFAVFGPVFEKALPAGLAALHRACQHQIPVYALGGVTLDNARQCLEAGDRKSGRVGNERRR